MNRHLRIIGAILRKDILVLWPLVAIIFVLLFIRSEFLVAMLPNFLREWMNGIIPLGCALLVIGVIHQDASASMRHDWLTRPIPRRDVVLAKLIFIGAAIYAPVIVFDLAHELTSGHSLLEAVLHATALRGDSLSALVTLIMFAAVTSTLLEAAGAFVALFAVAMLLQVAVRLIGDQTEMAFVSGTGWVVLYPLLYVPFAVVVPLLWLQYGQRKTKAARSLLAAAMVTALLPLLLTWNALFAIQKVFTTDESISRGVNLALAPGCFPAIVADSEAVSRPIEDRNLPRRVQLTPLLWSPDQRSKAGPGAIAFTTSVTPVGKPAGWKVAIGGAQASYVDDKGQILYRLQGAISPLSWATGMDASVMASHFWLVPRKAYEDARQRSARMQIEYSVSLLQPVTSAELSVDGERKYFLGLGFCSATEDRSASTVKVNCFKRGEQPALLFAELPDASQSGEVPSGFPDYTPAALEILSGASYRMTLRHAVGSHPLHAKVTAYQPRAHFDRLLVAEGVLGGPVQSCSAPAAETM